MTPKQPGYGTRWIVARIERLWACPHDVAVSYTRCRGHAAARVVPWPLASVSTRLTALRATLTRVPPVLLDPERHTKRHRLGTAGPSRGGASYLCARPSIRPLEETPPLANAPLNRAPEICRRDCSRRASRGRAPPLQWLPLRITGQGRSATSSKQRRDGSRITSSHSPQPLATKRFPLAPNVTEVWHLRRPRA
jgi:hypothetical protein